MHIEKIKRLSLAFILILFSVITFAQETNKYQKPSLQVVHIGFGSRVFEIEEFGNNPTTLAPLMKDPVAYHNFIKGQTYTGIYGTGSVITRVPQHLLLVEFIKINTASLFWKKYTVQAGLLLTNRLRKSGMGLIDEGKLTDSTFYRKDYAIERSIQFAGANLGVNRRFRLSPKVIFMTGLHFNLLCAVRHSYTHRFDSTFINIQQRGSTARSYPLPGLQGRNFTEWQLLLPLALEIDVYKKQFFLRPELYAGIISGKYRKQYKASINEGHGAGISLLYKRNTFRKLKRS